MFTYCHIVASMCTYYILHQELRLYICNTAGNFFCTGGGTNYFGCSEYKKIAFQIASNMVGAETPLEMMDINQ